MCLFPVLPGLVLAAASALGSPGSPKPWRPFVADNISATLHCALPRRVELGQTDIFLGTTTLRDLRRDRFIDVIGHSGDAAASLSWSCTDANIRSTTVRICPESSEIQGGDIVGSLTIERIPFSPNVRRMGAITFAGRVRFGDTFSKLVQTLGAPSYRTVERDNVVVADWRYIQPFSPAPSESLKIYDDLIVRFDQNLMTKVFLNRTTVD